MKAARHVLALLRAEPARASALLALVLAVLAGIGVPNEVLAALGALLALVLGVPLRAAVTPVGTAAQAVVDSAVAAASQTAARLDSATAGEVGELTGNGLTAVTGSVEDAVDVVLDQTGLNPKGRKVRITDG